jgi:hypothetical protein
MLTRSACARRLARAHGLPLASTDFRASLRRGVCARKRCDSRLAVVRVTVDLRDPLRQDYSAVLECAQCGHVWTSTRVPELRRGPSQGQHVALTIHTPPPHGEAMRAYTPRAGARARIVGTDARTITNATFRDLARELGDWRERADRARSRVGRAQDRALVTLATDRIARDVEPTPDMRAAMARIRDLQAAIAAAQPEE